MSKLRRFRNFTLALACGSVPVLLALSVPSQPAPASPMKSDPTSPQQVANTLDQIMQPRFQDVSAGTFGMTRLVPAARGHQAIGFAGYFETKSPAEARLLARADAAKRPYVIALLHCAHVPGKGSDPDIRPPSAVLSANQLGMTTLVVKGTPDGYPAGYFDKTEPALRKAAIGALPTAMKGQETQTVTGDWTVVLRPVLASQDSCLTCHTGTKRGDTLGVMVYAVSNVYALSSTASKN